MLWDTATGATLSVLSDHDDWVHSVALSADSRLVATASRWSARWWNWRMMPHPNWVPSVSFAASDANVLMTGCFDGVARIRRGTTQDDRPRHSPPRRSRATFHSWTSKVTARCGLVSLDFPDGGVARLTTTCLTIRPFASQHPTGTQPAATTTTAHVKPIGFNF